MLFISPTYKPFPEIPGGFTEDDESPLAACHREVREKLGLPIGRLLLVDWMLTHGVWRHSIQRFFNGGVLTSDQAKKIRPAADEVSRFEFLPWTRSGPG